jgi:hypothetical protein
MSLSSSPRIIGSAITIAYRLRTGKRQGRKSNYNRNKKNQYNKKKKKKNDRKKKKYKKKKIKKRHETICPFTSDYLQCVDVFENEHQLAKDHV